MSLDNIHTPVLLERTVELFGPVFDDKEAVLLDATLGLGGHSLALLERYPLLRVIGIDRDEEALALAKRRLEKFHGRVHFFHAANSQLEKALASFHIQKIDGALFDLGVSSLQIDRKERGFAYSFDAELDMRMDKTEGQTALDVIREFSVEQLRDIFWTYGEEKLALRYARAIGEARNEKEIIGSQQLVDILQKATPAALKNSGHPAKRVFQAIRIVVNDELALLEKALPLAISRLNIGGRCLVMSYQSLEDKIVKRIFTGITRSNAPIGLPVELKEHRAQCVLLTRGAEGATREEISHNSRSKAVKLRAIERRENES